MSAFKKNKKSWWNLYHRLTSLHYGFYTKYHLLSKSTSTCGLVDAHSALIPWAPTAICVQQYKILHVSIAYLQLKQLTLYPLLCPSHLVMCNCCCSGIQRQRYENDHFSFTTDKWEMRTGNAGVQSDEMWCYCRVHRWVCVCINVHVGPACERLGLLM